MAGPERARRERFAHFEAVPTRWMDNDAYGHVNNVVYYAYFDTVINRYLVERGGLDIAGGAAIGLCVESGCSYLAPVAFPGVLEVGLRVAHVGRSSVRYELGVFAQGADHAAAQGHFVHVFVDRVTRRPAALPDAMRAALERLFVVGA